MTRHLTSTLPPGIMVNASGDKMNLVKREKGNVYTLTVWVLTFGYNLFSLLHNVQRTG